ncbi:MAG TPA: phage tail protein [Chloroflexota bacterium]
MQPLSVRAVSADGRDGRAARDEPVAGTQVSSYLQYLPAPYQGDAFLGRFLMIFESVLGPIERTIDNLAYYFDPRLTPVELLPWLASWVGLELDENWSIARQRQLILWAATLQRWRGTRRALRQHLRLYTGRTPLIVENYDGARLGQDAALGITTQVGGSAPRPHWVTITVFADRADDLDEGVLRSIIELEKPAHVGYTLVVRRPDTGEQA